MLRPILLTLLIWGLVWAALFALTSCAPQAPAPVYIPVVTPPAKIEPPPDPLVGVPTAVRDAIVNDTGGPVQEGITTYFPYDPHGQQVIDCQTLHVTEIILAPDEKIATDGVTIGDSERWKVAVSGNHLMVKPTDNGISTNIVVPTDHRSYQFALRTHRPYMPQVMFYYPTEIHRIQAERREAQR